MRSARRANPVRVMVPRWTRALDGLRSEVPAVAHVARVHPDREPGWLALLGDLLVNAAHGKTRCGLIRVEHLVAGSHPLSFPLTDPVPARRHGTRHRPRSTVSFRVTDPEIRPRRSIRRRQRLHRRRAADRGRTPFLSFCAPSLRRRHGRSVSPRSQRGTAASAWAWFRYTCRAQLTASRPEHEGRRCRRSGEGAADAAFRKPMHERATGVHEQAALLQQRHQAECRRAR